MSADESHVFDWAALHDAGDVVVLEQPAIACYLNPRGAIVLRQDTDDDYFVWFRPEHAAAVAAAILEAAGLDGTKLASGGATTCGTTRPKDPTAAERQRRYRESKKERPAPEPDIFDRDDRDVTRSGVA